MAQELISIITPSYNSSRFVEQTLNSVLAQSYTNWEMVIVNDGSKDNSPDIIQKYADSDPRIRLIHQPNGGSAAARNNALRNANGRYICFLDADDLLHPNFLEHQLQFITQNNATIVFASYNRINEQGDTILRPFIVPNRVNYTGLLKSCSISCLTAMFDKQKTGDVYFEEALRSMRDDFVFWLTILKRGGYAYGNKEILGSYRVFANSTTGNKRKVIKPQFNVYYKVEKLGLIRSLYYLANWAIKGFVKYR